MKTVNKIIISSVVAGLALVGMGSYVVAGGKDSMERLQAAELAVSQEMAVQIASQQQPGTVLGSELEQKGNSSVWEIEIADAAGTEYEVKVDATTGDVLSSKSDDDDDEKCEHGRGAKHDKKGGKDHDEKHDGAEHDGGQKDDEKHDSQTM